MIKSMAPITGRLAVVVPQGVLFRKGSEQAIRRKIIEHDKLEAVIGLGDNLFYGTNLAACMLVLRHKKSNERKNRVLFIDASKIFKSQRAQNILTDENVDEIFGLYKNCDDVDHLARVVETIEIQEKGLSLNIPLYIEKQNNQEIMKLSEAAILLKQAYLQSQAADDFLKEKLIGVEAHV